jgi:hypothetical protein
MKIERQSKGKIRVYLARLPHLLTFQGGKKKEQITRMKTTKKMKST